MVEFGGLSGNGLDDLGVAVAVNNAHLFQETQVALAEVEALNRRLTRETWQDIGRKVQTSGYVFAKSGLGVTPAPTEWLPAMTDAVQQRSLAHHAGDGDGVIGAGAGTALDRHRPRDRFADGPVLSKK